jgi:ketosteroid isomerase-like protein
MNEAATSLAAAETAFAAHSVREGMRKAFLAAFTDDGVFVRTGWTNSNAYLEKQPDPPIVLDWRPAYVEVSASGDLGLSTGPWKLVSKADPKAAPSYGQFVSVWRRPAGGTWRVAVDLGIGHPMPDLWDAPLSHGPSGSAPAGARSPGVESAEAEFIRVAVSKGLRAAHAAHGAERLRFYRSGTPPAIGKAASLASPAMNDDRSQWTVEKTELASAGDLGYARGSYSDPATSKLLGYYLRVWRLEGSAWRVILDVTNPVPRPATS